MDRNHCHFGECRAVMRDLIAQGVRVHTCVTSPPYWALRDYGVADQLGLESVPDCLGWATGQRCGECYICHMVEVFSLVRDLLHDEGTCWLNIGDSYVSGPKNRTPAQATTNSTLEGSFKSQCAGLVQPAKAPPGLPAKNLVGIPWRLALALQADGWILRQDVIWHKPSPMPESCRDRCTKAHEYIFLLTKSPRYYFDAQAIRTPAQERKHKSNVPAGWGIGDQPRTAIGHQREGVHRRSTGETPTYNFASNTSNRRSVWTVASKPYKGAHFAVFPPDLIEPCILAGTSARGHCPKCGRGWERIIERKRVATRPGKNTKCLLHSDGDTQTADTMGWNRPMVIGNRDPQRHVSVTTTKGWGPRCTCGVEPTPGVVFDPFFGSGTTGMVARWHGRDWIGCELNQAYGEQQALRLATPKPAAKKTRVKKKKPVPSLFTVA